MVYFPVSECCWEMLDLFFGRCSVNCSLTEVSNLLGFSCWIWKKIQRKTHRTWGGQAGRDPGGRKGNLMFIRLLWQKSIFCYSLWLRKNVQRQNKGFGARKLKKEQTHSAFHFSFGSLNNSKRKVFFSVASKASIKQTQSRLHFSF